MTEEKDPKILFLCYGNPSRGDDGLGPAFADRLARSAAAGVALEVDYQLGLEHVAQVMDYDLVVFADAAVRGPSPFELRRVDPRSALSFSSHSLTPEQVLGLAREVFGKKPSGYVLAIRGYCFEPFREGLTDEALSNLEAAATFVEGWLRDGLRVGDPATGSGKLGERQVGDPGRYWQC